MRYRPRLTTLLVVPLILSACSATRTFKQGDGVTLRTTEVRPLFGMTNGNPMVIPFSTGGFALYDFDEKSYRFSISVYRDSLERAWENVLERPDELASYGHDRGRSEPLLCYRSGDRLHALAYYRDGDSIAIVGWTYQIATGSESSRRVLYRDELAGSSASGLGDRCFVATSPDTSRLFVWIWSRASGSNDGLRGFLMNSDMSDIQACAINIEKSERSEDLKTVAVDNQGRLLVAGKRSNGMIRFYRIESTRGHLVAGIRPVGGEVTTLDVRFLADGVAEAYYKVDDGRLLVGVGRTAFSLESGADRGSWFTLLSGEKFRSLTGAVDINNVNLAIWIPGPNEGAATVILERWGGAPDRSSVREFTSSGPTELPAAADVIVAHIDSHGDLKWIDRIARYFVTRTPDPTLAPTAARLFGGDRLHVLYGDASGVYIREYSVRSGLTRARTRVVVELKGYDLIRSSMQWANEHDILLEAAYKGTSLNWKGYLIRAAY